MTQCRDLRVVIVGGGMAGLAAAVALQQNGRTILVLEQSRMNKEVGALISLQPNASQIASKLGLDPFLAKASPTIDTGFRMLNSRGELQSWIPFKNDNFGADRVIYHRAALHAALRTAAMSHDLPGSPVKIQTSAKVVHCDCDAATLTLETGECLRADLIVGADGIHSVLRKFVAGANHNPIPTGLSAYRILIPLSAMTGLPSSELEFDLTDPVTTMLVGLEVRVVMGPGQNGELFGAVILVPDHTTEAESTRKSWTSPASKSDLLKAIDSFPQWLKDVFDRSPDDIALWQLRDIEPLQSWVKGRTILIGDAAHAMLPTQGQGASQSLEDAEALRAYFEDLDGVADEQEIHKRLQCVFEARYERASLIQGYSRQQGRSGVDSKNGKVTLNSAEFLQYNCDYRGAKDWVQRRKTNGMKQVSS